MDTAGIIVAITSALAAFLAVGVAYLTLYKSCQPQILAYYQPNPDTQTLIDLVVENVGAGLATNVTFSTPLPIKCFGIVQPKGTDTTTPKNGFPAISAKQRYIYDGGQFAGLKSKIGAGISIKVSYQFKEPLGFTLTASDDITLSLDHLGNMPSRPSANQAIVDALKSSNKTTVHEIRDELKAINRHLAKLSSQHSEYDTNS